MDPLPSLFLSHGSPILSFEDRHPAHQFLKGLAAALPRPKAILMVSAHWEAGLPTVTAAPAPRTVHDYGRGFPYPEMYSCTYAAPGDPALAEKARHCLRAAGIPAFLDEERGFDHGTWAPLRLVYPQADIPVVQMALHAGQSPAQHFRIGQSLAPLRGEGILLIGSGTMTHNQFDIDRSGQRPTPDWADEFDRWMSDRLSSRDDEALLDYRRRAPHALYSHPTEEHLMPLFVMLGAATPGRAPRQLHRSFTFSTQSMAAYAFD